MCLGTCWKLLYVCRILIEVSELYVNQNYTDWHFICSNLTSIPIDFLVSPILKRNGFLSFWWFVIMTNLCVAVVAFYFVLFCYLCFLSQDFSEWQLWLPWDSFCRPGWSQTLRDPPVSTSLVLGLKACTARPGHQKIFIQSTFRHK